MSVTCSYHVRNLPCRVDDVCGEPVGSQTCLPHVEMWATWLGGGGLFFPAAGVLIPPAAIVVVVGLLMLMSCAVVLFTPQDTCLALIADQCWRMTWKPTEPQKPT